MTDLTMPAASLSLLLDGLFDYAGLYPPASLSMDDMVSNWTRGLGSEHGWMLGRVIVPVSRLDEFETSARTFLPTDPEDDPWVLSMLLETGKDSPLEPQVDRLLQFNEAHSMADRADALIDVVELRGTSPGAIESALDLLPEEIFPFFELSLENDVRGPLASLVGSDAGAKVRTGGVRAELYPDTSALADFIIQCARADVPFKATAGMHHPWRNHNDVVDVMQFGFLNVFLAAIVASHDELDADALAPLLTRVDSTGIEFLPGGITLDGVLYDLAAIEDTRIAFALSYGSCSFDEPIEDLVKLGLLSN